MTGLKRRCTKALSHVNSLPTINILLTYMLIVVTQKSQIYATHKVHQKIRSSQEIRVRNQFCGYKFSRCMLIVGKLLTCLKRPVYRGLRGVMVEG